MKFQYGFTFGVSRGNNVHILREVRRFGTFGKCHRFPENTVIKLLKTLHLLFAAAWGGGALGLQTLLFFKFHTIDPSAVALISKSIHWMDLCVVMPGLFGCVATGLFYSFCTSVGFFKFFWIIYKWAISINAAIWGTLFLCPLGNILIEKLAPSIWCKLLLFIRSFLMPENFWQAALQLAIILSMYIISVYRPLSIKIKKDTTNMPEVQVFKP